MDAPQKHTSVPTWTILPSQTGHVTSNLITIWCYPHHNIFFVWIIPKHRIVLYIYIYIYIYHGSLPGQAGYWFLAADQRPGSRAKLRAGSVAGGREGGGGGGFYIAGDQKKTRFANSRVCTYCTYMYLILATFPCAYVYSCCETKREYTLCIFTPCCVYIYSIYAPLLPCVIVDLYTYIYTYVPTYKVVTLWLRPAPLTRCPVHLSKKKQLPWCK